MNKEMKTKPMSVARYEFMESLAELINNSMLPPFVLEAILKDTYNEVRFLSKKQLDMDMQKYMANVNKPESSNNDVNVYSTK